jgi:hypothetical protein
MWWQKKTVQSIGPGKIYVRRIKAKTIELDASHVPMIFKPTGSFQINY